MWESASCHSGQQQIEGVDVSYWGWILAMIAERKSKEKNKTVEKAKKGGMNDWRLGWCYISLWYEMCDAI